nr:hypothetical protein [Tanacetum cinerariifolium]
MAEGEIDNLTMEQYLALTQGNQAPGVVKAEIRCNVNFKIKSQFMPELREDTFSGNKNDDAHEHVERVLNIINLFNIPGVTHDAGPISGMTPVQALIAIQTLADHSQKWHDGSSSRNIDRSSNTEGIAAIVSKLDSLGRDMKKLKENVHAIQVGCQLYGGAHLDRECPLNEEVKSVEEVKDDMVTFDMDKKIHNFTTPVGKVYMVNSIHNDASSTGCDASSDKSPQVEKSNNVHHENNNDNYMQERSNKKARMLKPDMNTPSAHLCNTVKQNCNGILKDSRYVEWCSENSKPDTPTSIFTAVNEDCIPRPMDYPFKEWLLTKGFAAAQPFLLLECLKAENTEGDETLYQAWKRYNDMLYKCPTHNINSHQKVNIIYYRLGTINRQLLESQGPISSMTPVQALTAIQTLADHSQKWHDGSSSRNIDRSSNTEGIAAIVSKLDSLGRDMKKLKENVHAIQVGCQLYGGAHLDRECPLNEEVKSVEEVKYGKFGCSSPFSNGAKYHVGSLDTTHALTIAHHLEKKANLGGAYKQAPKESTRRRVEMEEWVKKLQENIKINTQNQSASLKNPETQIEQLTKEFHAKTASEVPIHRLANARQFMPMMSHQLSIYLLIKLIKYLSLLIMKHMWLRKKMMFQQKSYLGASVNVIPKSMFEQLKVANLKKTDMLVKMADMTKRVPIGIVENVFVKIDKFLFPLNFVVIDMLNTRNETMILGRLFLATIHAEIDVFNKEISLGIRDDRVTFDMDTKIHNFTTPVGKVYMVNSIHNDASSTGCDASSDKSPRVEKSNNVHHENNNDNYMQERINKKARMLKLDMNTPSAHLCNTVKQNCNGILKVWPTCDPTKKYVTRE